ncbi:MAG: major facilitator superfamily 1 [Thermoleophilia bacterium]|nr:major facilitator superfamily 1 [Thermoleophilia bacterium]
MVSGVINTIGLGLGALLAGLIVQADPTDLVLPWVPLAISLVITGALALRLPETVRRDPGARFAMRPPAVPRALLPVFALASLGVVASWANAGLYIALGPGMVAQILNTHNHVVGGLFIFGVTGAAAAAQFLLRHATNRFALVGGALALTVGSIVSATGFDHGNATAYIAGAIIVGTGFGAAFLGALRAFAVVLPPAHRASGMSAFFVVAYASMSIPAVGAGLALRHVDARTTLDWFGGAVAVVALAVAIIGYLELRPAMIERRRRAALPGA